MATGHRMASPDGGGTRPCIENRSYRVGMQQDKYTVASFYKHAPGLAPICLWSVYACKESGFEPYKSGRDQGRHACRGVMLIRSMLIKESTVLITYTLDGTGTA